MAPKKRAVPQLSAKEPEPIRVEPSPEALDAFVAGALGHSGAPRDAPKRLRAPRGSAAVLTRTDGTRDRKATIYFAPEVDDALEVFCAATGRQRKHVVNEAVREYLAGRRNVSG